MAWEHVSASQVNTWQSCQRRWYYQKIEGRPEPAPDQALLLGTQVHSRIEEYLTTGDRRKLGPIELAGLRFLPSPKAVAIELELEDFDIEGVPVKGKIDALNMGPVWLDDEGDAHELTYGTVEIIDWKTTSNLNYAKHGHQLAVNPQMLLYGLYTIKKYPYLTSVRLSHGSFQTKKQREAVKTTTLQTKAQITENFKIIQLAVQGMKLDAQARSAADVEPNFRACHSFNRPCPFMAECYELRDSGSALTDLLLCDTKYHNDDSVNGGSMSLLKTIRANTIDPVVKAGTPEADNAPAPKFYVGVNPPDAPPFDPVLATAGEEGQRHRDVNGDTHEYSKGRWSLVDSDLAPSAPQKALADNDVATTAPKKSKTKKSSELSIYLHAVPSSPAARLEPYIDEAAARLAAAAGDCTDIRCSKNPLLDFGRWRGALATEVRNNPPTGAFTLLSRGEIYEAAAEALATVATTVVRGVAC